MVHWGQQWERRMRRVRLISLCLLSEAMHYRGECRFLVSVSIMETGEAIRQVRSGRLLGHW